VKTILAAILTVLLLLPVSAIGEIQTVTHTVKQSFGGSQSPDDARISAIAKAKREALEMAGTYIESLTVVKNNHVDKDEILALAAGVLKAEVVSQENYHTKDAFGIDVVIKVVVDMSVLEGRVKKLLQDRTHLEELNQTRKKERELLDKVASLEEENRKLMAKNQSTPKLKKESQQASLKKEFQQASRGLTAVEWFDMTSALIEWDGEFGRYTDPAKAIEYLDNAIKLQPDFANAYNRRGAAYLTLDWCQLAIKDFNEAIRLKPDFAKAYGNRGLAYLYLDQYQRAIKDYDKAIRLKPDHVSAYNNRGGAYNSLGQYQRAIKDYDTAIRLKPDYSKAYGSRGLAYFSQGKINLGCRDAQKACELGFCDALEGAKGKGYCR
jgi:tetratricopeptide (TPR) repeat protein